MRRFFLKLLLVCASSLAGCAASPLTGFFKPTHAVQWPPNDPEPRIEMLFTYRGTDRSQAGSGFFARVGDFLVGSETFQFVSPYGIAGSVDAELYVADSGLGAAHAINFKRQTHVLLRGAEDNPMQAPVGAAQHPDGRLFVTDSLASQVHVFKSREFLYSFGGPTRLGRPTGIAYDTKRDRLVITDTSGGRLLSCSTTGDDLSVHGERGDQPGQFNYPTNVCITRDGNIVVVDTMNFRVQLLTPDFEPQSSFGLAGDGPGFFARPKGIGLDSEGHIYVVDAMFDNVQIFNTNGELMLTFAARGSDAGQLLLPSGTLIDDNDQIVISDPGNARIQAFKYHAQP